MKTHWLNYSASLFREFNAISSTVTMSSMIITLLHPGREMTLRSYQLLQKKLLQFLYIFLGTPRCSCSANGSSPVQNITIGHQFLGVHFPHSDIPENAMHLMINVVRSRGVISLAVLLSFFMEHKSWCILQSLMSQIC